MLKKFFLNALSSFVGTWMAIVLAGAVAVLLVIAVVSRIFGGSFTNIEDKSVLELKLDGPIVERDDASSLSLINLVTDDMSTSTDLQTMLVAISEAKDNEKIKAIYLDCGAVSAAPATLQALRTALIEFKSSGKKVYAYADYMTQGAYYVATVADEISLNPAGSLSMSGLGGQTLFYKNFFDKIGLEFQAVRVGEGKAAIEPFTSDTMSSVARRQQMQLLDTIWDQIKLDIAKSRPAVTPALVDSMINRSYISQQSAQYVADAKMVDRLEYRHEFESRVARAVGQGDKLENRVTPSQLAMYADTPASDSKDQVAVLYACGGIDDLFGSGGINSTEMVTQILKLKDDDNVKALVLRVNSPGGSAFGSEQIWEALHTFKDSGKPYIVSMGDYAASGGYYISCDADRIFANPLCITGSIGIFGLIPNVQGLLDKLGINAVTVATNPAGQYPSLVAPMDEQQLAAMQMSVDNGYALFVKRCAEGRGVSQEHIKSIADGRPLPAIMAKHYGLVDELGSLSDAVAYAAKAAKLKEYNTVSYPEISMTLMGVLSQMEDSASVLAGWIKLFTDTDLQECAEQMHQLVNRLRAPYLIRAEYAPIHF